MSLKLVKSNDGIHKQRPSSWQVSEVPQHRVLACLNLSKVPGVCGVEFKPFPVHGPFPQAFLFGAVLESDEKDLCPLWKTLANTGARLNYYHSACLNPILPKVAVMGNLTTGRST